MHPKAGWGGSAFPGQQFLYNADAPSAYTSPQTPVVTPLLASGLTATHNPAHNPQRRSASHATRTGYTISFRTQGTTGETTTKSLCSVLSTPWAQSLRRSPGRVVSKWSCYPTSTRCKAHGQQHPREWRTQYGSKGYPPSVIRQVDDIVLTGHCASTHPPWTYSARRLRRLQRLPPPSLL